MSLRAVPLSGDPEINEESFIIDPVSFGSICMPYLTSPMAVAYEGATISSVTPRTS